MLVLGVDTSSQTGAIGLVDETGMLGEINIRLSRRHSERLLPDLDFLFQETERGPGDLEGVGVATGPGSFTGIRIGLITVKAFLQVLKIPVIGLSTLEIMAASITSRSGWIVPVLDARRERVYTALFQGRHGEITESRIWPDQAMTVNELLEKLATVDEEGPFYLVGDGALVYRDVFKNSGLDLRLQPGFENQVRGGVTANLARKYLISGKEDDPNTLRPNYLKKTQAEINWQKKHSCGEDDGD